MKKTNYLSGWNKITLALALAGVMINAQAADAFSEPDASFSGSVRIAQQQPVYAGTQVTLAGQNFKPGQQITLERGKTVLNATPYSADKDGKFEATLDIPKDAAVGQQPLVVKVAHPDAALIYNLKVSPQIAITGSDLFDIKAVQPAKGLYQSAYSTANNALFVTSAVGRPPVKESTLVRVNPDSLAIEASVTPAEADEKTGVYAVYGVGVDDKHGNVWVTNTRQSTLAIYSQKDLKLVKQLDRNVVPHPRDVVIDEKAGKAYVSSPNGGSIYVFDTETFTQLEPIAIRSGIPRSDFKPMSLALDKASGTLYTVSLSTAEAAAINTATNKVEKIYSLPGLMNGAGVSVDAQNGKLYVTGQGSDDVRIVDLKTGETLHRVLTGAGALNVAYNPHDGFVYVANRGAGTVTVINSDGKVEANLDVGPAINHISVADSGRVFVVNKAQKDNSRSDHLTRLEYRN